MELIYEKTEGVSTEELYYDSDRNAFYIEKYHCGVVDPGETFSDGSYYISKEEAFERMISNGQLNAAARYYKPEDDGETVVNLLEKVSPKFFGFFNPELRGDKKCVYYVFPDNSYVIYYHHTYFTPNAHGIPDFNYPAVKEILDNAAKVRVHVYSYLYGWKEEPLIKTE